MKKTMQEKLRKQPEPVVEIKKRTKKAVTKKKKRSTKKALQRKWFNRRRYIQRQKRLCNYHKNWY